MKKQIIINASQDRSRIAIVEDGELVELYVENPDNVRTIGNIYLGKVEKVMPTLRAGFVNIGEKQDAFLHFSDLTDNFPQLLKMSGEDVPGLDEPVLSLAPQKRIADDESEPDIEDVLEVESADEETAEPSRNRSTRSRRTRGRGGRGRTSEEEEQEEAGEERPTRRGMMVLDLSSGPKKSAPKPASRPAPAVPKASAPDAPAPSDVSEPVAEAVAESVAETPAPRSRRAPRAPRTAADLPPVEAETTDETPVTAEAAESAPKAKRSRSRTPAATPDDTATTDTPVADAPEADAEPASRSRRGRSAESRATAAPDAPDTAMAGDATDEPVAPTARPRRQPRNRPAPATPVPASAPVADAPDDRVDTDRAAREVSGEATTEDTMSDAPRSRSRRRTRGGSDAPTADTASTETTDKATDATPVAEVPEAAAPVEAPTPRPRGLAVVDLSSSARPASRPAPSRPEPTRAEPARTEPDAPRAEETSDEDDAPRSRRRGRDERPDTSTTSDSRSSDDATDAAEEDTTRSRRRPTRRSDVDDARTTDAPETDAPADDTSDDDAPRSRGRRSTRGRSDDARTSDDDRTDDAPEARSDEAPDTSRGRRSTRDGRDGSGRDSSSREGSGRESSPRETSSPRAPGARRVPVPSNEQLLRRGGNVIVKVTKEPISAKGSRVSTDISLAGRFLVLVPAADYVAVSKKIESAKERRRLRTLAQSLKPDNCGVIVRTVAEGRDAKSLDTDLRLLIEKWHAIEAKLDGGRAKAPILLYEDVNMVSSIIRDLFSEDFDRILVDDPKVFKNVQAYVKAVAPDMADKVELHRGSTPAFRSAGIEKQVEEAFSRRVNLKSGGYLFIETTEAMHVVDVNSGRAGRGKSQKENMISVNVEAAREVAKQLRLRDLGGIIVVDFIDLRLESDRRKVTNALQEGFAKDRAVTKLLPMSDFGLVQITRQRLRPSITAQPEGEDTTADPAERAARAGAGEIEQAGGRRGRGDDARGLDAGPAEEDARPARSRDDRGERSRDDREERPAREPRVRDDRSRDDRTRDDRGERPERPERSRRGPRRDDAEDVAPEPAASPESATALLRGWLDNYRRTVDEAYRHRPVVVRVHPLFLTHLQRGLISMLTRWRIAVRNIPWRIEEDSTLDPLAFDIRDEKSGRSLLKKYSL